MRIVRVLFVVAAVAAFARGASGCKRSSSGSQAAADAEQQVVQGVAEGREVTVTVHLEVPPEQHARDRRVRVTGVQFGPDGAAQTFFLMSGPTQLTLPRAAFRKVLVPGAPVTIGPAKKR